MKCTKCKAKMVLDSIDEWVETEKSFGKWYDVTYRRKTYACTKCDNIEETQTKVNKKPAK